MPRHLVLAVLIFPAVLLGQTASSTSLTASPNPSNYGQAVALTATVTSGAAGKVTFYDGVTILGVGTISGTQASISTVMLPSGNRKLRAYYQGDGTYAASSSTSFAETVVAGSSLGLRNPVSYPSTNVVSAIAVGDFNGDGQLDLVIANGKAWPSNPDTNSVTVLIGNGDGTFQTGATYTVGTNPSSVAVGDFNGDGKMDVVVANRNSSNANVLLGNGDGTFQPAVTFDAGTFLANGVVVADFNGDGKADLVFVDDFQNNVTVLLGNGDGTFGSPASVGLYYEAQSIAVADFDGDGKPDLLVTGPDPPAILLGNGDGTFHAGSTIPIKGYSAPFAIAADFDSSGKADILLAVSGFAVVIIIPANGDGTFESPQYFYSGCSQKSVLVADFNGDGKEDVGCISYGSSFNNWITELVLLLGNGDGTLSAPLLEYSSAVEYSALNPIVAVAGDFNGDGRIDLVFAGTSSGGGYTVLFGDPVAPLTIQTDPAGLPFTIDGGASQPAPQTINLTPGTHTIAVAATQAGTPGTQYLFTGWSDSVDASRTITVSAPITYTASFKTQYQLTTAANPASGGSVTPASSTWVDSGTSVSLSEAANSPLVFTSWSGGMSGASNPLPITMNAPISITANFDIPGATCTITGDATASVADVQFILNEALGIVPANNDQNNDGAVNIADIQRVIAAAMNLSCLH